MSNYISKAINPRTNEIQQAEFLDNYFGPHRYGIRFSGEQHVYPDDIIDLPTSNDKETE